MPLMIAIWQQEVSERTDSTYRLTTSKLQLRLVQTRAYNLSLELQSVTGRRVDMCDFLCDRRLHLAQINSSDGNGVTNSMTCDPNKRF